jgi:hypothetical protein
LRAISVPNQSCPTRWSTDASNAASGHLSFRPARRSSRDGRREAGCGKKSSNRRLALSADPGTIALPLRVGGQPKNTRSRGMSAVLRHRARQGVSSRRPPLTTAARAFEALSRAAPSVRGPARHRAPSSSTWKCVRARQPLSECPARWRAGSLLFGETRVG